MPYFETIKSFADIAIDEDGIQTVDFLLASDGLLGMFDLLGIGIFSFVQADIKSNIRGVRETCKANPEKCHTLETLVHSEDHDRKKYGTTCLRRLLRGQLYTCRALQYVLSNPQEERLEPSFRKAYEEVLQHHHNKAIRAIVSIALKACPWRKDFFDRIRQDGSPEKLHEDLLKWLASLDHIVTRMVDFYANGGYGMV